MFVVSGLNFASCVFLHIQNNSPFSIDYCLSAHHQQTAGSIPALEEVVSLILVFHLCIEYVGENQWYLFIF